MKKLDNGESLCQATRHERYQDWIKKLNEGRPKDWYEKEADRIAKNIVNNKPEVKEKNVEINELKSNKDIIKTYSDHPLEEKIKQMLEPNLGVNLDDVKIHTDKKANEMADSMNAKAFTVGNDIYFNRDEYNPDSTAGKELIAHEVVHTIQQAGAEQIIQMKEGEKGNKNKDKVTQIETSKYDEKNNTKINPTTVYLQNVYGKENADKLKKYEGMKLVLSEKKALSLKEVANLYNGEILRYDMDKVRLNKQLIEYEKAVKLRETLKELTNKFNAMSNKDSDIKEAATKSVEILYNNTLKDWVTLFNVLFSGEI